MGTLKKTHVEGLMKNRSRLVNSHPQGGRGSGVFHVHGTGSKRTPKVGQLGVFKRQK